MHVQHRTNNKTITEWMKQWLAEYVQLEVYAEQDNAFTNIGLVQGYIFIAIICIYIYIAIYIKICIYKIHDQSVY